MNRLLPSSRRRRVLSTWLGLVLALASAGTTRAQDRFSAEEFDPTPDQNGGILSVYGARTLKPGTFGVTVMGSYGRKPITLKSSDSGNRLGDLVGSVGTLQLMGVVGIARRLDFGVAIPVHRMSEGSSFQVNPGPGVNDARLTSNEVGLGDIRLVPRLALLEREAERGVGLALVVPVWLPTGNRDIYAGEPVRVEPRLVLDFQHGGLKFAFNVGYMIRSRARLLNSVVDDQLRAGVGLEVPFTRTVSGLLEVNTQVNVLDEDFGSEDAPTEGLLGLRIRKSGLLVQMGAGPGIVRGVGAPSYRMFASVGYATEKEPPKDQDQDGIPDDVDQCPKQAEDLDSFEDGDGCPDLDDDRDGVPDANDRCPHEAEDNDGFEDEDGCPELDNDQDGIPDVNDRCPTQPEDVDGFEDDDGCPELDNDQDGTPDASDACVDQAGPPENRGCPVEAAPEPQLASVSEERIELNENVYFEINSAVIEARSGALLDAIAEILKSHPEIELVQLEAHTDDTGKRFRNVQLSEQRAKAVVDALVQRGVAPARLKHKGHGPDKPIVPNDSEENRAKNRRAELHILKRSEPAQAPAP